MSVIRRLSLILIEKTVRYFVINRKRRPLVFYKSVALKNFVKITIKAPIAESLSSKAAELGYNFIEKVTLTKVFCCELCGFF